MRTGLLYVLLVLAIYGTNLSSRVEAADGRNKENYNSGAPKRAPPGSGRWQPQQGGPVQRQPAAAAADSGGAQGFAQQQQQQQYPNQAAVAGEERQSLRPSRGSDDDEEKGVEQSEGGQVKPRFPGDRVPMYTKKVHHRAAVALVAFVSATGLAMVLVRAIFSKSNVPVALVFAIACFFSCYTSGDFSRFSNALGVGTILFLRKLRPRQFFTTSTQQLISAFFFAARRPFPPVENPWTCKDVLDASEVPFSMINSILSMLFFGMFMGYNITKRIPLFPGWIGGLSSSIVMGYTTTTRNTKGDLLRYLGHSINVVLSEVQACADDVYLREKSGVMLNKTFFFINKLDQRFGILQKTQAFFNKVLELIRGLRSDMDAERNGGKAQVSEN